MEGKDQVFGSALESIEKSVAEQEALEAKKAEEAKKKSPAQDPLKTSKPKELKGDGTGKMQKMEAKTEDPLKTKSPKELKPKDGKDSGKMKKMEGKVSEGDIQEKFDKGKVAKALWGYLGAEDHIEDALSSVSEEDQDEAVSYLKDKIEKMKKILLEGRVPEEGKDTEAETLRKLTEQDDDFPVDISSSIRKQLQRTAYIISKLPDAKKYGVGDTATDEEIAFFALDTALSGEDPGDDPESYSLLGEEDESDELVWGPEVKKLASNIRKEIVALAARLQKDPHFGDFDTQDYVDEFYQILHGSPKPVESKKFKNKIQVPGKLTEQEKLTEKETSITNDVKELVKSAKDAIDKGDYTAAQDLCSRLSQIQVAVAQPKEEETTSIESPSIDIEPEPEDTYESFIQDDKLQEMIDLALDAGIMNEAKKDPKAKLRNRGDVVFPAGSPKVTDEKDHFPINNKNQARNALARANQYKEAPKWYKGSLDSLVKKVANSVQRKYKDIEVTKAAKTPGKG